MICWSQDSALVPVDGIHAEEELDLGRNLSDAWVSEAAQLHVHSVLYLLKRCLALP